MVEIALINLILFNFQQSSLSYGVIFHCWKTTDLKILAEKASDESLFLQFATITKLTSDLDVDLYHRFLKHKRSIVGVFVDLNCPKVEHILKPASLYRLYSDHYHWLFYDRFGSFSRIHQYFGSSNVSVDSDVTYAAPDQFYFEYNTSSEMFFILYDVYNNGPMIGGKLNVTADRKISCTAPVCVVERYFSDLHKRSKYGNRNRQSDITFRAATMITQRPLSLPTAEKIEFLLSDNESSIDSIARFGFHQLVIFRDMLQCDLDLIWFKDWSINDTKGGSVGAMINETVDLISTPLAITSHRIPHLIGIGECATFHAICMFRTPVNIGDNSGKVFLEPFSTSVWIAFGVLVLIAAIELWLIFIIEDKRMESNSSQTLSILTSFLIAFGAACVQGSYLIPKSMGGRIFFSALIIASFIMYNYYTSVIVSTLLGSRVKSDIKSIAQIADSQLNIGVEPVPFNTAYLNTSQDPAIRRLMKRKIEGIQNLQTVYMSVLDGVLRVRDEKNFAFIFEASTGFSVVEKYYDPEQICDLNEVFVRPERNLAMTLHRNSSFVELFRLRLLRILETGVNRRVVKKWLRNRLYCFAGNTIVSVGLEYTSPLFVLLAAAFVLSAILLLFEILWQKCSQ